MSPQDPHKDQPVISAGVELNQARTVLILIHGRGASAQSMLTLAGKFNLTDVAFLAPQASGHTWYPNSFLAPISQNEPALSSALGKIASIVETAEKAGHSSAQIALLGFSQGACLASEFVARNPARYGGLVAYSGGLIGSEDARNDVSADKLFEYDGSLDGTPVFLGCSDQDPHIPVERVDTTEKALSEMGAEVQKNIYKGMGHTIIQDEIDQAQHLFDRLLK